MGRDLDPPGLESRPETKASSVQFRSTRLHVFRSHIPYYDCAPNHPVNHQTATLSLLEPAHRVKWLPMPPCAKRHPSPHLLGHQQHLLGASLSKPPLLCLSQIAFPFPSSSVPDTIHLLRTENCLLGTPAFLPTIGVSSTDILIVKDQLLGVFSGCLPCLCPGALGP